MVFCNLTYDDIAEYVIECHNPYFNRWFSAIRGEEEAIEIAEQVTILILIDGFLQFRRGQIY